MRKTIKKGIKTFLRRFNNKRSKKNKKFPGSKNYWEDRYQSKNNSGAGSYGRLAAFKAEILNNFVINNQVTKVIELGCGDGNQLSLSNYPNYIGFDVSETAIKICEEKFKHDASKKFYLMDDKIKKDIKAPLVLSLDVLYHLIEDVVFEDYMYTLFSRSSKYVIIYSSNYDDHFAPHVKCRKFTEWIAHNIFNSWELIEIIKNKYPFDKNNPDHTSMADFYIFKKTV